MATGRFPGFSGSGGGSGGFRRDFDPRLYGRPPANDGGSGDESFEAMRQKMERDREAFFRDRGLAGAAGRDPDGLRWPFFQGHHPDAAERGSRPWVSPDPPGGFYRPSTPAAPPFDPSGAFKPKRPSSSTVGGGLFDGNRSADDYGDDNVRSSSSPRSSFKDHHQNFSVPIRVVHMNPSPSTTTTDSGRSGHLRNQAMPEQQQQQHHPAQQPPQPPPRGDRAASEPPWSAASFSSPRTNQQQHYASIPEASEVASKQNQVVEPPRFARHGQNLGGWPERTTGGGGRMSSSSGVAGPSNLLSTSASSPNVVGPPKPQLQDGGCAAGGPHHHDDEPHGGAQVRHIPIFVEGRGDPVYSKRLSSRDPPPSSTSATPSAWETRRNLKLDKSKVAPEELTSPLSPPPGPIPMGYTPAAAPADVHPPPEPTSPVAPPTGPIPMPCSPQYLQRGQGEVVAEELRHRRPRPSEDQQQQRQQEQPGQEGGPPPPPSSRGIPGGVHQVPIRLPTDPIPPAGPGAPDHPAMEKLEEVRRAVEGLAAQIEAFTGCKGDKEYLYLDEMLTRHMLSLDGIDTGGRDDIRGLRKEAIRSINRCLSLLDLQAGGKGGAAAAQSGPRPENCNEDQKVDDDETDPEIQAEKNNAIVDQLVRESCQKEA